MACLVGTITALLQNAPMRSPHQKCEIAQTSFTECACNRMESLLSTSLYHTHHIPSHIFPDMSSTKPSTNKKTFKKDISEADEKEAKVVRILTDQKELGNQAESGWKPIVWTAVVAALAATFNTIPQKKCQAVQIQMAALKALHEQSGFGWDDMKQMVTVQPDVWDKYLEIVEMVIATGSGTVHLAGSEMGEGRNVGGKHSEGEEGDAGDEKDGSRGGIDGVESDSKGEAEVGTVPVYFGSVQTEKIADCGNTTLHKPETQDASTAPTFVSTPQWKTKALQTAENEEERLSDNEIVEVATLFSTTSPVKYDLDVCLTKESRCMTLHSVVPHVLPQLWLKTGQGPKSNCSATPKVTVQSWLRLVDFVPKSIVRTATYSHGQSVALCQPQTHGWHEPAAKHGSCLAATGAPAPVLTILVSRGSGTPLPLPPAAATITVAAPELCLAAASVTPAVLMLQPTNHIKWLDDYIVAVNHFKWLTDPLVEVTAMGTTACSMGISQNTIVPAHYQPTGSSDDINMRVAWLTKQGWFMLKTIKVRAGKDGKARLRAGDLRYVASCTATETIRGLCSRNLLVPSPGRTSKQLGLHPQDGSSGFLNLVRLVARLATAPLRTGTIQILDVDSLTTYRSSTRRTPPPRNTLPMNGSLHLRSDPLTRRSGEGTITGFIGTHSGSLPGESPTDLCGVQYTCIGLTTSISSTVVFGDNYGTDSVTNSLRSDHIYDSLSVRKEHISKDLKTCRPAKFKPGTFT
ncbi:hypothetical protein K439DRAFT_1547411 [Ramaria rubella]|nr:hypothetical protein K439DRAFT_1547411 [Ramaria rubella]